VADAKTETMPPQQDLYQPKCLDPGHYRTLRVLCQVIIPADEECGGAVEAGVPEWIDTLASHGLADKTRLMGGLTWIDVAATHIFGNSFPACSSAQQKELLDLLAGTKDGAFPCGQSDGAVPGLSYGRRFFTYLRSLAADGFFTSKIGMAYPGYLGNKWRPEFTGCPPLPDEQAASNAAAKETEER